MPTINSPNISHSAMLVKLTVTQWTAKKLERGLSREIATNHGNQEQLTKVTKVLGDHPLLAKFSNIANAARATHALITLPWEDGGVRLLNSQFFFKYDQAMSKHIMDAQECTQQIEQVYESEIIQPMEHKLNGLFNRNDYPNDIASRFGIRYNVGSMPNSADFRVNKGLTQAQIDKLKQDIEDKANNDLNDAYKDIYNRINTQVSHLKNKLENYEVVLEQVTNEYGKTVTKEVTHSAFRDSLVQNVKELCTILPMLNIADDPVITDIGKTMQQELCAFSAETLRINDSAREATVESAASLLDRVKAYI